MPETRDSSALIEEIERLKREREQLIIELWRRERRPSVLLGSFILLFGIVSIILSITFSSYIMSLAGLALAFLGVISIYIRPARYVQSISLEYTASTLLKMAQRLLSAYDIKGKGVYLPPLLLTDLKDGRVFVNSDSSIHVPEPGDLAEGKVFTDNPRGICLTPAGLGLANLVEEKLRSSFTQVNLGYVMEKLPEIFTDVLEITEAFEISSSQDLVFVKAKGSVFFDLCREMRDSLVGCSSYGCPFCSSIAIALTRCLGKPIIIERSIFLPKSRTLEIVFRVIKT